MKRKPFQRRNGMYTEILRSTAKQGYEVVRAAIKEGRAKMQRENHYLEHYYNEQDNDGRILSYGEFLKHKFSRVIICSNDKVLLDRAMARQLSFFDPINGTETVLDAFNVGN